MPETTTINYQYKDRLFKFIFGNPVNREWTLNLYNAVNGTHYMDADSIELTTIEDAVYMSMKNDVSFLFSEMMNFYEQQSSFDPNVPMRFFVYIARSYSNYIKNSKKYRLYSSKLQKAPTPKCVCFYNGTKQMPDKMILKLSDAFDKSLDPDVEVKVTMLNINYGHNKDLLDACKPLHEYSWFVDRIRSEKPNRDTLGDAVDTAIKDMPDDFMIKSFLLKNQEEVKTMCITEYNEEEVMDIRFEEGKEEGREEGIEIGGIRMLIDLVKKGMLTLTQAAEEAHMSVDEFESKTGLKA